MTAILLWLELTLFAVVSMAAVRSVFIRWASRFVRDGVPLAWFVIMVLAGGWAAAMSHILLGEGYEPAWAFWFFFFMTLCVFAGGGYLHFLGGERLEDGSLTAGSWPAGKLSGIALLFLLSVPATVELAYQLSLTRYSMIISETKAAYLRMSSPHLKDEDNAYYVYRKALGDIQRYDSSKFDGVKELLAQVENGDGESVSEARKFVERNGGTLKILKMAASMDRFAWDVNPALDLCWPGAGSFLPRLAALIDSARALALEAKLMAIDGDVSGALENINLLDSMERQFSDWPPSLLSALFSNAIFGIKNDALLAILSSSPITSIGEIALPVRYHVIDGAPIKRGIAGEFIFQRASRAQAAFEHNMLRGMDAAFFLEENEQFCGEPVYANGVAWMKSLEKVYVLFGLGYDIEFNKAFFSKILRLAKKPPPEFISNVERLEQQTHGGLSPVQPIDGKKPSLSNTEGHMNLAAYVKKAYVTETEYYLSKTALAAQIYKARSGEYPASLEALVPEYITGVPIDPFSGAPLRMASSPGGLVIYSVGPDFEDNGGHTEMGKRDAGFRDGEDIAVRLGTAYIKPESGRKKRRGKR